MVNMWAQLNKLCVLQMGHSGDVYDWASCLCKYDLFVRVGQGCDK